MINKHGQLWRFGSKNVSYFCIVVTLVAAEPSSRSNLHHPNPGDAGWYWGWCGCHKGPCQTKFLLCQVPCFSGIKLQLLCCKDRTGCRIPPLPRQLSGFPICKSCLDLRPNPSRDTHFTIYGRCPLLKPKGRNPEIAFYLKNPC